jgi:hypothetical protein
VLEIEAKDAFDAYLNRSGHAVAGGLATGITFTVIGYATRRRAQMLGDDH